MKGNDIARLYRYPPQIDHWAKLLPTGGKLKVEEYKWGKRIKKDIRYMPWL